MSIAGEPDDSATQKAKIVTSGASTRRKPREEPRRTSVQSSARAARLPFSTPSDVLDRATETF
jgi:hypothetical protein